MRAKISSTFLVMLLTVPPVAHPAGCDVPQQIRNAQDNEWKQVFLSLFVGASGKGIDCGSIASLWYHTTEGGKPRGRKLEPAGKLDVAAAQSEWQQAQADPNIGPRLAELQKTTTDPTQLVLYQAALLDQERKYLARDWRLLSLKASP
jgi:hypothetical protein